MSAAYLSDAQLAARFGVSRATIWRWSNALPDFPKPKRLGPNTTRWSVAEAERYEQAKSAKAGA